MSHSSAPPAPPHPSLVSVADALRMIKQVVERPGNSRVELEDKLNSVQYFLNYARSNLNRTTNQSGGSHAQTDDRQ